jgi:hypothetical protein
MKRAITVISQSFVLLAFVVCSIIAALDLLGWLDFFTQWKPDYLKLVLLLVGALGTALVLQHWLSLRDIEDSSSSSNRLLVGLSNTLLSVDELRYPTRLLNNREAHSIAMIAAIDSSAPGSNVDVTHFEKLRGAPYDVGENAMERLFMERWKAKVKNGHLIVRQIIHVSSGFDILEVERRLLEFADCMNYSANVICGMPVVPYVDVLVIRNQSAFLDLSSDPLEPFRASIALEATSPGIVQSVTDYFEIWWSQFSTPVKNKDGIRWDVVERIKRLVPMADDDKRARSQSEFALLAQRYPELRVLSDAAVTAYERVYSRELAAILQPAIGPILGKLHSDVTRLFAGPFEIGSNQVERVLLDAVTTALRSVDAVSYDFDQPGFWNSTFGRKLLGANEEAHRRGVSVRRVFVIPDVKADDNDLIAVFRAHCKSGVQVFYVRKSHVGALPLLDILLRDDTMAFEMSVSADPEPVKNGVLFLSGDEPLRRREYFNALLLKCTAFSERTRAL